MGRDEAQPPEGDRASEGHDVDMDIVAATYRTLSDATAFDSMIMAWESKLAKSVRKPGQPGKPEPLQIDSGLARHLGAAHKLIQRMDGQVQESPIDAAVSSVAAPAIVLDLSGIVAAENLLAYDRFSSRKGQLDTLGWLHPSSTNDFEAVRRSAQDGGNRKHAIVRTSIEGSETGIAEVYVIEGGNGGERYIAVRALEVSWGEEVDAQLAEAFDLTEAEREVARLLFETRDSAQIAQRRETSAQTVRTQIKRILAKTETSSQVDLIRMLALLSARASSGAAGLDGEWHDPWGNEQIMIRPDGRRLAYSWTGARNGRPVLLVHGLTLGYVMGPRIERQLKAANIKLIALIRPGCGKSDISPPGRYLRDHAEAIGQLLDHLELTGVPAVGLSSGCLPLVKAAADRAGMISSILTAAYPMPLTTAYLGRLARFQRAVFTLAGRLPDIAKMVAEAGHYIIKRKGIDWYIERGWDGGSDNWASQTIKNPQIIPTIRIAAMLTFTAGGAGFMREARMHWSDRAADITRLKCPVHSLQGLGNRPFSPADGTQMDKMNPLFTTEEIEDAGYFLPYEKPDLFFERMIALVED